MNSRHLPTTVLVMLKLLCGGTKRYNLDSMLRQELHPQNKNSLIKNNTMDENGNPILFAYFLDMRKLHGLPLD